MKQSKAQRKKALWKTYIEAEASLWKAYLEARVPLLKAYLEACKKIDEE